MVQQTLKTPNDLLHFQLRTAMTMENDSLAALGELQKAAKTAEIKQLFRHHADETKEQIANLQQVFRLLEFKESTAPSPSTKGISKQAASLIERSAPKLRDQVALSCALGNEHYEISAYHSLIVPTSSMGMTDVVSLLQANLDQEVHTSEELQKTLQKIVSRPDRDAKVPLQRNTCISFFARVSLHYERRRDTRGAGRCRARRGGAAGTRPSASHPHPR